MHMTEPAFKILRFNPGGTGTIFFAIREDGEPDLQEWEREDA
jgi:hypothetical protein